MEAEARAKPETRIKEKAEKTRKEREAREKMEAETVERERAWAEAKARDKADISRIAAEAREKAEFEVRVRKNANAVNRGAVEAATKIRFSDEIQRKRERGRRLRQGPRLRLIYGKMRRRRGRQGRQRKRQRMSFQRGQGHGPRTKQVMRQRSSGLLPRLWRRPSLRRG